MATEPLRTSDDFANLDLLRSWAVLSVCGSHLLQFLGINWLFGRRFSVERLGLWGVVIFFVHTCLVLMLSLERHGARIEFKKLFSSFMVRRCFRIYPLSILAVGCAVCLRLPVATLGPNGGLLRYVTPTHWEVFCNVALIQNLANKGTVLGPLWSLPLEIQMYLLLPGIFILTMRPHSLTRTFALWLAAFAWGTVALRHPMLGKFPLYMPCFIPGVIAYRILQRKLLKLPALLWPVAALCLTALAITEGQHHMFQYWMAALALGAAIPFFSQVSSAWLVVPSRLVARYSYGIYLSHFFCIWMAFGWLSRLPVVAQVAVFVITFAALPILLYHLVEEPLIGIGKRLADRIARRPVPAKQQHRAFLEPVTVPAETKSKPPATDKATHSPMVHRSV